jgi:hypothetical protein
MPKPWNETVYFVTGAYKGHGGWYAWGNDIKEALINAKCQGASPGDLYLLLTVKGDFSVSQIDGSLSHEEGGIKYLTPKDSPRKFPSNIVREAKVLEELSVAA